LTTPSTENSNRSAPPLAVNVTEVPKQRGEVRLLVGEDVRVTVGGAV